MEKQWGGIPKFIWGWSEKNENITFVGGDTNEEQIKTTSG